jgi:hypothetical protein
MYQTLINNIVVWERGLEFESEQRKVRRFLPGLDDSMAPGPCQVEFKTIFTWNYKFEKVYQPLFSSLTQDCVAVPQPC